jgi:hypothetical protein
MTKTIVFDVDGILLDFNKKFKEWVFKHHNLEIEYNPEYYSFYEYKHFSEDKQEFFEKKLMDFIRRFENNLPLIDAKLPILINKLRDEMGYKIVLITAYGGSQELRKKNLTHFGIKYDRIIFEHDKLHVVQDLKPEVAICVEDRPLTVLSYAKHNIHTAIPTHWTYCKKFIAEMTDKNLMKYIHGYSNTDELEQCIIKVL